MQKNNEIFVLHYFCRDKILFCQNRQNPSSYKIVAGTRCTGAGK